MKKLVASVGMLAVGLAGLHTDSAQGADTSKPWSVGATLRGFYDDNVSSLPDDYVIPSGYSKDTFGFQVNPFIGLNLAMEQTTIALNYDYSFKWYEETPLYNANNYDQSHTFNALVSHTFSERYQGSVRDSFVIGQEPDRLRAGSSFETFQRVSGNNIRNVGGLLFNAQVTPRFGVEVGYDNWYFNYDDDGASTDAFGGVTQASYSGLLDRIENMPHLDLRWLLQPTTVGLVGYQYRMVDYTADEAIAGGGFSGPQITSDMRNSRAHYGYLGVEHTFRPDLTGKLKAGASWADYYNDPSTDSGVAPYLSASVAYTYAEGSTLEVGLSYDRMSTDLTGYTGTDDITQSMNAGTVYVNLRHRITPKIYGSILGQFQNSIYNGGSLDGEMDQFYVIGLNVEYQFNPHLSAQVGYNYDLLSAADSFRDFDRNRVYLGVTARY